MKKRLRWLCGVALLIALVVAGVIWFGGMTLGGRLDELSARAEALGMNLKLPDREPNAEAERLRSEIDSFSDVRLPSIQSGKSFFSEEADEIQQVRADIEPVLPKVFALSNCKSFGRSEWTDMHTVTINCAEYLMVEGNAAIIAGDIRGLTRACGAIRRIAHLVPSDEVIGAAMVVLMAQLYTDLLQRGAEAARTDSELQLVFDEANRWLIKDFTKAAANFIAEEFLRIEQDSIVPIDTKNPIEYAEEMSWRSEPGKKKRKILAVKQGMAIYPQWSEDAKVWKTLASYEVDVFNVNFSAKFLKLNELQMRRNFTSVWATLHSRRRQIKGISWPTVEELEALGVEVRDPLTGNLYEWRKIDGKRRLYGKFHTYGDNMDEDFLLVSDGERQRAKDSR